VTATVPLHQELGRTLADAALENRSGIVNAVQGKQKRLFCILKGLLSYATSNVIEEQFSELLVIEGLVSVGDLAAAQRACGQNPQYKLSLLLVEHGLLTEEVMASALERYIKNLLFTTLDWTDGQSSFVNGQPDLGEEVTTQLAPAALLVEYAQARPASLSQVRSRIPAPTTRLVVRDEGESLIDRVTATDTMRRLLKACTGETPISGIVSSCEAGEETAWRSLYALWLLGLVEPAAAAAARSAVGIGVATREEVVERVQSAREADHYAVLGLRAGTTREKILEAYYVLARKFHPDRHQAGPLADLRQDLEEFFSRVTEAYNTLYDSARRAEYDAHLASQTEEQQAQDPAFLAQANYRRAKALVARGRFTDAATSIENAIQLDPGNPIYRIEAGRLLGQNPRLRDRAEEHLTEANRLDPSLVDGYYELGQLYVKMRRKPDAVRMLQEVLRWDAGHTGASELLRELGG